MDEHDGNRLESLLDQLRFDLERPVDFTRADPVSIADKVRVLTAAAHYFNTLAVSEFGGRIGSTRAPGLVEQVVAAAFQTFGGVDPHPGPFDKAAMLFRGITQGHPFMDGNKRTGFLTASFFLRRAGIRPRAELAQDPVLNLCALISAGTIRDVDQIAAELRRLWGVFDE